MQHEVGLQIISLCDKEKLSEVLKEVLKEYTTDSLALDLIDEELESIFRIEKNKKISDSEENNKYINRVILDLSNEIISATEPDETEGRISEILLILKERDEIKHIIKFYDYYVSQTYAVYYEEIYKLENKLREVLSYIFNITYPEDLYKTLSNHKIFVNKEYDSKEQKHLEDGFENEFFYLDFSGYKTINETKEVKQLDLLGFIKRAVSFDSLKEEINKLGINTEYYKDFIESIREILDPIEAIRNCIMHSRKISDRKLESYEKSKEELLKRINDFWENLEE